MGRLILFILTILLAILEKYGVWIFVGVLFLLVVEYLIRIILDENKSALFRALFFKALYYLTKEKDAEKKYISNDIFGRINTARTKMHYGQTILPKGVSVEWVEGIGEEGRTYDVSEKGFVVRLDPSQSQEKNIVCLATSVVQRTSLQGIRHIINNPVQKAIDINIVKSILRELSNKKIMDWFYSNEYERIIKPDEQAKIWNTHIVEIDEKGLFTRMLLVELDEFSKRIYGREPRGSMSTEVENLIKFLYQLATRKRGEVGPLDLVSEHIKMGVIRVAKTRKILYEGIGKYIQAMDMGRRHRLNTAYLIIYEKEQLKESDELAYQEYQKLVDSLSKQIGNMPQVKLDFKQLYSFIDSEGKKAHATCVRYTIEYPQVIQPPR